MIRVKLKSDATVAEFAIPQHYGELSTYQISKVLENPDMNKSELLGLVTKTSPSLWEDSDDIEGYLLVTKTLGWMTTKRFSIDDFAKPEGFEYQGKMYLLPKDGGYLKVFQFQDMVDEIAKVANTEDLVSMVNLFPKLVGIWLAGQLGKPYDSDEAEAIGKYLAHEPCADVIAVGAFFLRMLCVLTNRIHHDSRKYPTLWSRFRQVTKTWLRSLALRFRLIR
jgi:hypothetical protein